MVRGDGRHGWPGFEHLLGTILRKSGLWKFGKQVKCGECVGTGFEGNFAGVIGVAFIPLRIRWAIGNKTTITLRADVQIKVRLLAVHVRDPRATARCEVKNVLSINVLDRSEERRVGK